MRDLTYICVILAFLLSISSVFPILADIPTVVSIDATEEGEDAVLVIEIRHSSPSSSHYVDVIEVEISERLDRINDLEPQTSTTFTYEHNIGTVAFETIRVRAHCTDHGWSPWGNIGALPEPSFLETPIGMVSIAVGIAAVVAAMFAVLKKTGRV